MPSREKVYAAIDGERQLQEDVWKNLCKESNIPYKPALDRTVGDWLIYIRGNYNDAIRRVTLTIFPIQHVFRELANLCFTCMEMNGVVGRFGPKLIIVPGNKLPIHREDIQRVINVERSYQDELPPKRTDSSKKSPCDYLVMFGTYLRRAEDGWTNAAGNVVALDNIRKLGAIAVRCMEEHGAPHREGY